MDKRVDAIKKCRSCFEGMKTNILVFYGMFFFFFFLYSPVYSHDDLINLQFSDIDQKPTIMSMCAFFGVISILIYLSLHLIDVLPKLHHITFISCLSFRNDFWVYFEIFEIG